MVQDLASLLIKQPEAINEKMNYLTSSRLDKLDFGKIGGEM